jgi:hypothetical protein
MAASVQLVYSYQSLIRPLVATSEDDAVTNYNYDSCINKNGMLLLSNAMQKRKRCLAISRTRTKLPVLAPFNNFIGRSPTEILKRLFDLGQVLCGRRRLVT